MEFERALAELPLIAILRHLDPAESTEIGRALVGQGFRLIEVPLNQEATALRCIELLAADIGDDAVVGAGTVTSPEQVGRVRAVGGALIVSPDMNPAVVAATKAAGMTSCPGISTPTEAFAAVRSGADLIKLFPGSLHGPGGLKALLDVLPPFVRLVPVGGVTVDNAAGWRAAGAAGLGIGSALFKPGLSPQEVGRRAAVFRQAWDSMAG